MRIVGKQKLGVKSQVLLLVNLDPEALEHAQGGERVENIPIADSVLASAENAHVDPALSRLENAIKDDGIDEFRMLDIELVLRCINEIATFGDASSRCSRATPVSASGSQSRCSQSASESFNDLRNPSRDRASTTP